jgi:Bacterial Ig domain
MKSRNANLLLLAATTLVVAACSRSNKSAPMGPSGAVNQPPVIAAVADQAGDQDTVIGPVTVGVTDKESDAATLNVVAAADSASLFPADGVVVSGAGATRTVTLTPLEGATGTATIALTVTDAENASAVRTFKVTINARNASVRDVALNTFAKAETDDATVVNGFTFTQDADDPSTFDALIPPEAP